MYVLKFTWGLCLVSTLVLTPTVFCRKTNAKGSKTTSDPSVSGTINISEGSNKLPQDGLTARILQVINPNARNEFTVVSKPINSEIVVGRDLVKGAKLILECSAPYPVQWIYAGDGTPEISTNTSSSKSKGKSRTSGTFTATAALGFSKKLVESDTGKYICRSVQNSEDSVFYYIYVPGKSLFTSSKSQAVITQSSSSYLRIPCSVTSPDVVVALQKKKLDGFLECPADGLLTFNSMTGFTMVRQEAQAPYDTSGEYLCIGSFNGTYQVVEYLVKNEPRPKEQTFLGGSHVISEFNDADESQYLLADDEIQGRNSDENSCTPNPCGPNSICRLVSPEISRLPVCKCKRGYDGAPPQCKLSTPCDPSPCGPNSRCQEIPGRNSAQCSCLSAYIGRPPNCRPECLLNLDCPESMACVNQQCEDPCEDLCGEGAQCHIRNHVASCTCPPGYSGNPRKNGKCGRSRVPSVEYFPVRPGYEQESEESSAFSKFACEPWPCGPHSECRPVGDNAYCSCSAGFVGRPPNCQRPDCRRNGDCPQGKVCVDNICRNPCDYTKCGQKAKCMVVNRQGQCYCPDGFKGDPTVKCRPFVTGSQNPGIQGPSGGNQPKPPMGSFPVSPPSSSEEYPLFPGESRPPGGGGGGGYPGSGGGGGSGSSSTGRPITIAGGARPPPPGASPGGVQFPPHGSSDSGNSPCERSPCGKNAICSFRNQTVGCKCPVGYTGFGSDPYVECRLSENPCEKCGPLSKCDVMKNRQPVCSCLPGKVGTPPNCRENDCERNRDCQDYETCRNGLCSDPCVHSNCGKNAVCRPIRHQAVCACLNAPDRDPLYGCPPLRHYEGLAFSSAESKYYSSSYEVE